MLAVMRPNRAAGPGRVWPVGHCEQNRLKMPKHHKQVFTGCLRRRLEGAARTLGFIDAYLQEEHLALLQGRQGPLGKPRGPPGHIYALRPAGTARRAEPHAACPVDEAEPCRARRAQSEGSATRVVPLPALGRLLLSFPKSQKTTAVLKCTQWTGCS